MNDKNKTARKIRAGIITIILLSICLAVTTFALVYSIVEVDDNVFVTGSVRINLNDGKPVIEENEFIFEPGVTVEKTFFLENESTCDVYYRLYLENIEGGLAGVLDVTIKDGDTVIASGKASELVRENAKAADDILKMGERKELTIIFHFPEDAGNASQGLYLYFDLSADAVQTKNNPDGEF